MEWSKLGECTEMLERGFSGDIARRDGRKTLPVFRR
jgi:hypothetical protein